MAVWRDVSHVSLTADAFMTVRPRGHITLLALHVNSDILYINSYP